MDSQITAVALYDSDSVSVEDADAGDADLQGLHRLFDNLAAAFHSPDDFAFLSDTRIVVPGMPNLHVHHCVLCTRSPFLRSLFVCRTAAFGAGEEKVKDKEKNQDKVKLRELLGEEVKVGHEALRLVLEYLYSGRVGALPKVVCLCINEGGCAHLGCSPCVAIEPAPPELGRCARFGRPASSIWRPCTSAVVGETRRRGGKGGDEEEMGMAS